MWTQKFESCQAHSGCQICRGKHHVTERRACKILQINRNNCRYEPEKRRNEDDIRAPIIWLAINYGRIGYRMVTYMLQNEGVLINLKRMDRIWHEESLKLSKKQVEKLSSDWQMAVAIPSYSQLTRSSTNHRPSSSNRYVSRTSIRIAYRIPHPPVRTLSALYWSRSSTI